LLIEIMYRMVACSGTKRSAAGSRPGDEKENGVPMQVKNGELLILAVEFTSM